MAFMRGASIGRCIILFGALPGIVADARGELIEFVSDPSWIVSDWRDNPIGYAQYVAANGSFPVVRPPGATVYGDAGVCWVADLSSIRGAFWVWAPGITGATPGASLAGCIFTRRFYVPGKPVRGAISIAVDDFAEVFVNGVSVGATGSVTDKQRAGLAQSALTTFDISPWLVSGQNTIRILARNGPDSFSGVPFSNYSQNPAGVVFGGALVYLPAPDPDPQRFVPSEGGGPPPGMFPQPRRRAKRSRVP